MRWLYGLGGIAIGSVLVSDIWCTIDYKIAANTCMIIMAILTTIFAILYGTRSKWWTNRIGRVFLAKAIISALVLVQAVITVWIDEDYPGREVVRFVIYAMGAVAYAPMIVSLLREQHRDRRK